MRRSSRAGWAVAAIAPWCLAVGVLVSFTASAGQDPASGWNRAPRVAALGPFDSGEPPSRARIETARLTETAPLELHDLPDEREPHADIKPRATAFPEVDRTRRGDPIVAIRPSLDGRSRWTPFLRYIESEAFSYTFADGAAQVFWWRGDAAAVARDPDFASALSLLPPTVRQSVSAATRERAAHGATPAVSRAAALSSATPAQPDALPVAVAAIPRAFFASHGASRPDYAALIDREKIDSEKRCLAEAVYFEARSEPEAGQAAVAQVVLNRVSSGLYPDNICGVVYQNRHHFKGCQFSFACEGKPLRIAERDSWATALRIAESVLAGRTYNSDVGPATHYHANYVRPRWARSLKRMDVIGRHVFYRLFPGQT